MDGQAILDWVARQNLNPCFLPQLSRFSQLVILTPLETVVSPSFVQRVRAQAAVESAHGNLCVFLAPRLSETVREDLQYELRKDSISAGVLDDLDICRLLNPGGRGVNRLLALLELVFEQQRPGAISPFERHDGQHVRREMFVGREEQAREIAWTSNYSRLFSGRKLGKSALLSFVRQAYDGTVLPSGNTLRVLYVTGVSAAEEAEMVHRVLDAMSERLDFTASAAEADPGAPGRRLVAACEQFVAERPRESILVLFDEADLFVERQVADYETRREECLSFLIRSEVESHRDSRGLPRVRFLFSGYRVTHVSAGAWAGAWGDVLRLEPLHPDDAARLVRGPLERLGIDAIDVAPSIAWRCGYQPAIIIAFCRQLLQGLGRQKRKITSEDVAATFESTTVQDEIRAVIDSNFQGNALGKIIFLTTVLEFYERRPGEGIQDLAEVLFRRFQQIEPDIHWLEAADDQSALSRIAVQVQDFVRRQLLRAQRQSEVTTYFPRFPHHFPILADELSRDPEGRIRKEIDNYRRSRSGLSREPIRSLFSNADLQALRDAIAFPAAPDLPVRAAVVAGCWQKAVRLAAIAPDLPSQVFSEEAACDSALQSPRLVLRRVPGRELERILSQRSLELAPPLLSGGADLLRVVLEREQRFDELFELRTLGRISRPQLEWWFNRMRALELPSDGYIRIMAQTSGIPILVRLMDEVLQAGFAGGTNLSDDDLTRAFVQYDEKLVLESRKLIEGPSDLRLKPREIEILKMIARLAAEAAPGDSLTDHLTVAWDLYSDSCPVSSLSPDDAVAMRVVQLAGFVPVDPNATVRIPQERFVAIAPDDALLRIVASLGETPCS